MFIVRTAGPPPDLEVALVRRTPDLVRTAEDERDYFCLADGSAAQHLASTGWTVVPLKDGWYDDDQGGGVAVWGSGRYFELRQTRLEGASD